MLERRTGSFNISSVKAGMSLIKEIGSIRNTVITIMRNICIMPYRFHQVLSLKKGLKLWIQGINDRMIRLLTLFIKHILTL